MALPLPNLDDRRWVDLVQEGRSLIPLYAPGWTDHNVHDPGITLVELLAWVAEIELYRINRVPASHRRKFLSLVGIEPRPPRAARTVLAFSAAASGVAVPAGFELEGADLGGVRTVWRTLEPLTVSGVGVQAIQSGDTGAIEDLTPRWRRGEVVAPFGVEPGPGAALYLGFDEALPVGAAVTLYLRFAGGRSGWDERQRLLEEARRALERCSPPGPVSPCRCGEARDGDAAAPTPATASNDTVPPPAAARTAWELQVAPGVWRRLDAEAGEVADDTRSFTLDGRVVIAAPVATVAARVGAVKTPLHYLRCRITGGTYDAAPALAQVVMDGVAAEQSEAVEEPIGSGNGEPYQQLAVTRPVIADGEVETTVVENGVPVSWSARPDFDVSGRAGSHFVLAAQRGQLTFGDGDAGRRLPSGALVRVGYRSTRAAEGNVPAGLRWRPKSGAPGLAATNPVPAEGGAAAESLAAAAARAVDSVEQPLRAVTLADYEAIALATPGVRLARVAARANLDPALPCLQAIGVVTVIVLPFLPQRRPFPSAFTRRAVARALARHRLLGTRIVVVGPEYVEIAVRARVQPLVGVDPAALRARIVETVDRFFHPLTGGPDGKGWPFGRDVYRSEVLQLIDEVPGVDHVLALELIAGCACEGGVCGNVCVGPIGLVAAGRHEITVG
ncbi:MAG TPA: putative baseplate assembly protein [Thermoanaerobaculia bacterium]|jgi:predicted phage baseplate assembly protein|nr:putative baseplate assembly protein [Thermoanaerobaculia bacterium]